MCWQLGQPSALDAVTGLPVHVTGHSGLQGLFLRLRVRSGHAVVHVSVQELATGQSRGEVIQIEVHVVHSEHGVLQGAAVVVLVPAVSQVDHDHHDHDEDYEGSQCSYHDPYVSVTALTMWMGVSVQRVLWTHGTVITTTCQCTNITGYTLWKTAIHDYLVLNTHSHTNRTGYTLWETALHTRTSQQTRYIGSMLVLYWPTVCDADLTLNQS